MSARPSAGKHSPYAVTIIQPSPVASMWLAGQPSRTGSRTSCPKALPISSHQWPSFRRARASEYLGFWSIVVCRKYRRRTQRYFCVPERVARTLVHIQQYYRTVEQDYSVILPSFINSIHHFRRKFRNSGSAESGRTRCKNDSSSSRMGRGNSATCLGSSQFALVPSVIRVGHTLLP